MTMSRFHPFSRSRRTGSSLALVLALVLAGCAAAAPERLPAPAPDCATVEAAIAFSTRDIRGRRPAPPDPAVQPPRAARSARPALPAAGQADSPELQARLLADLVAWTGSTASRVVFVDLNPGPSPASEGPDGDAGRPIHGLTGGGLGPAAWTIRIDGPLPPAQAITALFHEIAHVRLHHLLYGLSSPAVALAAEAQAHVVSLVASRVYGLPDSDAALQVLGLVRQCTLGQPAGDPDLEAFAVFGPKYDQAVAAAIRMVIEFEAWRRDGGEN
jgi:hypothetical protein